MSYDIFICYESTTGSSFSKNLKNALEKRRGYNHEVFLGDETLVAGDDWINEIDSALNSCKYFMVIITALAMDSDWVISEYNKAVEIKKRIIPCRYSKIFLSDTNDLATFFQIEFSDKSDLANKVIIELQKIEKGEKAGRGIEKDVEEFRKRGSLLNSLGKSEDGKKEYQKAVKTFLSLEDDYYERHKIGRRVFFSFHYERDIWRANQVRNSWLTKSDREAVGFSVAAEWEEVKKKGDESIKHWLNKLLNSTSVTVVLIGNNTSERKFVQYEIKESLKRSNGLIGIYIHNLKDQNGKTDIKGSDPFVKLGYTGIKTYDWVNNNGYENLGDWIEAACKRA